MKAIPGRTKQDQGTEGKTAPISVSMKPFWSHSEEFISHSLCSRGHLMKHNCWAECQRIDAFETVLLEKTLESPLDSKDIRPVNPKGNQPWIFFGRTDAEVPILWPPDTKSWLLGKDPDARKAWGQEEKRVTEDEVVGWHQWTSLSKLREIVKDREAWRGVVKSRTGLSNWTTTTNGWALPLSAIEMSVLWPHQVTRGRL